MTYSYKRQQLGVIVLATIGAIGLGAITIGEIADLVSDDDREATTHNAAEQEQSPDTWNVRYTVTGDASSVANVAYADLRNGERVDVETGPVSLPFTTEVVYEEKYLSVSFTTAPAAMNSGTLTCTIEINGEVVETETREDTYVTCTGLMN